MAKNQIENMAQELAFSLHEMLGVPESTALQVASVSGPTTSITLRVTIPGSPGPGFFVKTLTKGTEPGPHLNLGLREVRFYELIRKLSPDPYPNIPRRRSSYIPEDESNYFLVLEDLSASHHSYESMDFRKLEPWETAVTALAKFHQCFTRRLCDDQIRALADDRDDAERYLNKLHQAFTRFESDHRDVLDSSVLSLMQRSIPLIRAFEMDKVVRVHQNKLTTILNRDAHMKNFLYPRNEGEEAAIVDWQFWGLGIGAFDLRHLLGSALNHDLRGHQVELVRHYFDTFQNGLDVDYSWEDCWLDYRKGIIDNLFMPVWQYTGFGWGIDRWGKTLEAAVENYHALDCDQIVN